MSRDFIEVLPGRWIVHARQAVLTGIEVLGGPTLRLVFDTGLLVQIIGEWRASAGSPRTGPDVDLSSGIERLGAGILSLVLFESGAVRLVLSDGIVISARAANGTEIKSALPGEYEWSASETGVSRLRSKALE